MSNRQQAVAFAYSVDKRIKEETTRSRSSFSKTQKQIMDKIIIDHFSAGSTVDECWSIVWQIAKSLED